MIVVRDHPGFWVNRILSPYLNEAGILVEEGVPIDVIDAAMTKFGFPVGPVALLDEVGLDVAQKAAGGDARGVRRTARAVGCHREDAGRRPARAGRTAGASTPTARATRAAWTSGCTGCSASSRWTASIPADVERRLLYVMLNEAAMAHGEGVVRSARDGDIGAIFGIGFPPFRGGPLRMIDDLSATRVVDTLRQLATAHGPRFTPAARARRSWPKAEPGTIPQADPFRPAARTRGLLRRLGMTALLALGFTYLGLLVLLKLSEDRLVFPVAPGAADSPRRAAGLDPVRVEVTDGGQREAGRLAHGRSLGHQPRRWLLMFHGNGGDISHGGRQEHYAALRALGLNLLTFDYRGYGESDGAPSEAGIYRDADAAYAYLRDTLGRAARASAHLRPLARLGGGGGSGEPRPVARDSFSRAR